MKTLNTLPRIVAILLFIITVSSCDEDFNTIGTDIIGDDSLLTELYITNNIVSYSRILNPVQTNFIPVQQLGIYNDHVFGKSTSNYVTQLILSQTDPTFGDSIGRSVSLDSVILYIPFFSESTIEEGEGEEEDITTYTLDSIFGNSPVTISVYESNFFLRDLDPNSNFEGLQFYYSNQDNDFDNNKGELLFKIEDFTPSNNEIVVNDSISLAPGLRILLPNDSLSVSTNFFQQKILDREGDAVLLNNNNFKDYLRGLYFKVESNTDDGSLFIFNPENASIALNYSYEKPEFNEDGHFVFEDGEQVFETIEGNEYFLNFGGVYLNVYNNELPQNIIEGIENPDIINGEESLYIRGGEGIITVINLFSGEDLDDNGVSDELDSLRIREPLINDAFLKFYVDQDKIVGGSTEPERLIIYDLNNGTVLTDYFLDTTSGEDPIDAINIHLGRLERDSDENGKFYKISLANHISNLINKDSTNVPLGLTVSQNVLMNGFQLIDTLSFENNQLPRIKTLPRSSVISPEGTVLFGNNTVNEDKRLKLEISYLEPN